MSTRVALVVLRGSRAEDASARERAAATQAGCEVLHVVEHGVLVRGRDDQLAQVAARDFRVEIFQDTEIVRAGKFRWRVDEAPPVLEPEWDVPPAEENTWPHRLVHFIGPPIPEWIREVEARGATVIDNIGRYGLLISASPTVAAAVAALPWVTFSGLFRPGFRLAPTLFEKQGRIRFVAVTVFPREAGTAVGARIEQLGGRLDRTSTDGPFASIVTELDADAVRQVARLPDVRSLSYLDPQIEPIDELSCQIMTAQAGSPGYPAWLSDINLTGSGVTIAFADTGISPHPDLAAGGAGTGRYKAAVMFGQGGTVANADAWGHGTYVAGIAVGDGSGTGEKDQAGFLLGQGLAPGADFVSLKLAFDTGLTMLGAQNVKVWAAEALNQNASIMCNAWQQSASASDYNAVAADVDAFVREHSLPMITGAGNTDSTGDPVTVPGLAKNVISVGASGTGRPPVQTDAIWETSGRGRAPAERFLPTVVAPGRVFVSTLAVCGFPFIEDRPAPLGPITHAQHALGAKTITVSGGAIICGPLTPPAGKRSGTSWAAAHVSGVCALLMQAWKARTGRVASPALLKAWLINGAIDLGQGVCPSPTSHTPGSANCLHAPSNVAGWGRVSLDNMLKDVRGPRLFFDQPLTFTQPGEEFTVRVAPVDAAMPMRITLVWTDPPGDVTDNGALRHDLNLEVELANGSRFLGNINFNVGFSSPAAPGTDRDHINNIECVYLKNPAGIHTVRVFAPPAFAVGFPTQDFALVIENAQLSSAPSPPTNLVIVMDGSGSMQGSGYAPGVTGGASLLLDLLRADDEAGLVSFGTGAQTELGLAAIGDKAAKQAASAAAAAVTFGGCTFMGAAIEQTKQLLAAAANPQRAMVLVSDGFDNKGCQALSTAKPTAIAATTAGAAVPVYACVIGPASDHVLLEEIASASGGRYYYAPSERDLAELFGFIRADVNDVAVVVSEQFATSTHTVIAPVDRQATAVTFAISWTNPKLQLVSTPPGVGQIRVSIVDPNGRNLHLHATDVRTVSRTGHVSVNLNHPLPGKWQIVVSTAAGGQTPSTATVFVESPLRLEARLNAVKLTKGSTVEVVVPPNVLKRFGPKVTVKGRIISPTKSAAQVLAANDKKLKPSSAAAAIAKDGVPTKTARLIALHRMLRAQGKAGVFPQVERNLTFRTAKGPGGAQRVAKARLNTPGSYNLVVIAEGITPAGPTTGKPSPVRRTLQKSILVVEGP